MEIVLSQPEAGESAPDVVLTQTLERLHTGLWPPGKPAWKVVFLEHFDESDGPRIRLDIAFLAHHAIADGMSGISFHTSLMENFQHLSKFHDLPPWPMIFPDRRPSPKQVEEFIDTLSCTCEICNGSSVDNEPIWGGNVISSSSPTDFKSRVRLITIHSKKLSELLRGCKQSKITLTGLLHGFICASLCHRVKEAPGFRGVTPFAVRNHTKASSRDIVNHVSFLTSFVPGTKLQEIRESTPHSAAEEHLIIQLAESMGREIATTVKQFPHGCMTTKISRIENMEAHCGGQEGKERSCTYELSNLGSVSSIPIFPHEGLKLEKLVFTQCGMVVGPALSFNCASVRDGLFTMSITWEEGIVEESLVEYLARDLQQRLENGIHRH
ncbi:hypothetical protein FDECE_10295 [Fusarium decemcellulare]|nr:hypothetical protein FDECE_10295 [Fusarium decemcellulare]